MFYMTKKGFWMDQKIIRLWQLEIRIRNQQPEAAQAEMRKGKDKRREKLEKQHRVEDWWRFWNI